MKLDLKTQHSKSNPREEMEEGINNSISNYKRKGINDNEESQIENENKIKIKIGSDSETAAANEREIQPFDVCFPYDRIYPEQKQYIKCVKRALRKKGHALIEAPPGTNQSLCLFSLLTPYQQLYQDEQRQQQKQSSKRETVRRKIIYATNSVPETIKVIRELAITMDYRQKQKQLQLQQQRQKEGGDKETMNSNTKKRKKKPHQQQPSRKQILLDNIKDGFWKSTVATPDEGESNADPSRRILLNYNRNHADRSDSIPFLAVCLKGSDREMIDAACRRQTPSEKRQETSSEADDSGAMDWTEDGAEPRHIENQNKNQMGAIPPVHGIFSSLQELHEWASAKARTNGIKDQWSCSQDLTKYAIQQAHVLVVTYPFLLDPMTSMMIGGAIYDDGPVDASGDQSRSQSNQSSTNDEATIASNGKGTKSTSTERKNDAIVVFDHAHNIDAACMDALSATVNLHDLEQATRSLDKISSEISRLQLFQRQLQKQKQKQQSEIGTTAMDTTTSSSSSNSHTNVPLPLKSEYESLVRHPIDSGMYRPILFPSDDVINEPVPGNIRQTKHLIGCMKKIVEHFKNRMKLAASTSDFKTSAPETTLHGSKKKKSTAKGSVSPLAFLHQMRNATALDSKPLRFVYSRVLSMLRTLKLPRDHFAGLINVAYLASLLGFTNTQERHSRFSIVLEQTSVVIGHSFHHNCGVDEGRRKDSVMMLQVACLDPSLAIQPIFDRFHTVILTSSTLSPLSFYPKILQFEPVVAESIPMTTIRPCVNPIMISRGSDQLGMSTSYKERFTMGCIRNYGKMLVDLVSSIPDGVVVYFPSYNYMEALICEWDATGIMREMTEWKLVFVETKDNLELNAIALDNYRASCDIGRGGVFFSVARGTISEAVPFDLHYGRALVMIGIPYEYTLSKVVRARLEYIQTHFDIREQDYLTFDAVRQVAKCFGRAIRSKTDYGVLIFADNRFHRIDKRAKLPGWVTQFLTESQQDLTTDSAVAQIKSFLRQTGQPVDQALLQNVLMED